MMFNQNDKPCSDESYQCLCNHKMQEDSSCPLDSCLDIPLSSCASKFSSSSGEEHAEFQPDQGVHKPLIGYHGDVLGSVQKDFGICREIIISDYSKGDSAPDFNLPIVASGIRNDATGSEPSKRSFSFDESYERGWKRSRQVDYCSYYYLSSEIPPQDEEPKEHHMSDTKTLCSSNKDLSIREAENLDDLTGTCTRGVPSRSWETDVTEENIRSEPSGFPHEFYENNNDLSSRSIVSEEAYSSFLDYYSPRKHVALGPDHQVDIPAWSLQMPHNGHDKSNEKLMGTCVIPMPHVGSEVFRDATIGKGSVCCDCPDDGSVRCVRQHVAEAREKLKKTIGPCKFEELGFYEMGEDIATRWSQEEEHVFHQVVFANPPSRGKNFWNILPHVFPSRSIKEFVSYYFNVYMLRKRSEQNRFDPMNIDSDSDEWQGRNDGGIRMEDCEEDSVVESPMYHEDVYDNVDHEVDDYEEHENFHVQDVEEDASDDYDTTNNDNEQDGLDVSQGCSSYKLDSVINGNSVENKSQSAEHDFQDDSCTSYEIQHTGVQSHVPNEILLTGSNSIDAIQKKAQGGSRNDDMGHLNDYGGDQCDTKSWDLGYFSMSKKVVDFLPTCNVIEEVFGKGTWDSGARDGQGAI